MYCFHCGKQIKDNASFCPFCGEKLSASSKNQNWIYAIGYIPVLFWVPLVVQPKTEFGKEIANQSLLLLIFMFLLKILEKIFNWSFIFWPITTSLNLLFVLAIIAMVFGIVYGASHKLFRIPIIGSIKLIH